MASVVDYITRRLVTRDPGLPPRATPKKIPEGSVVSTAQAGLVFQGGKVAKANAKLFRKWARESPWVRAAIDVRKSQVSSAEWDVVPYNTDLQVDNVRLAKRIKDVFDAPNSAKDS